LAVVFGHGLWSLAIGLWLDYLNGHEYPTKDKRPSAKDQKSLWFVTTECLEPEAQSLQSRYSYKRRFFKKKIFFEVN
jgi:hypothetical protein